jgi:hypothetical protein
LHNPGQIALSGGKLFVSNSNSRVGVYDAATGAMIDKFYISSGPGDYGIAGIAVVGGFLFVVNHTDTIGKYNATTGARIDRSFISSGSFLGDIAVSGGNLFVSISNTSENRIGKFNATTGATIDDSFISFPAINSAPRGIAISGENLFVTLLGQSNDLNMVGLYNATTGATIDSSFISSGLNVPEGIVVIPPSSVPDASPTLTLLLLGIAAIFGFNLLRPQAAAHAT